MPQKKEIINRLIENCAEIITEDEFRALLESKKTLTHYIGFEISGYVHLGVGIMSALVIKDLQELGVRCTVWLADWHTWINEKLDGKKSTAIRIGEGYFTEAIKASLMAVGADPEKVEFRLASAWYDKKPMKFWETVVKVGEHTTLSRMLRSVDIMGRKEGTEIAWAKTLYPAMQVADIIYQDLDIAHSGMDQRKAHVIMRDVADKVTDNKKKAVAIHHPLLIGLQKPPMWPIPEDQDEKEIVMAMKMSKSKADSAIWIHDDPEIIEKKVAKAFCPEKEIKYNPVLNWAGHVLFWDRKTPFVMEREAEHGGNIEFQTYEELKQAYAQGEVHPMDLKAAVAKELIALLEPVRKHFARPEIAKKKEELDKILVNR